MPPQRTGTTERVGTWPDGTPRFQGRLRLADGTKSDRIDVPQGMAETDARAFVAAMQATEDSEGPMLAAKREKARLDAAKGKLPHELETANAWFERFLLATQPAEADRSRARWSKWIGPHIGELCMTAVTSIDIERVRDELDAAMVRYQREGKGKRALMPKTAATTWSVLTNAFRHACHAKDRALRVLATNPCTGVLPPEKGDSRKRTFLYPAEVAQLLACEAIPVATRAVYAAAIYLYVRPNELEELRIGDIDTKIGIVGITRAWDRRTETVGPPKTRNGVRDIPIEPALLPLLTRLCKNRAADALLFPEQRELNDDKIAATFRAHLALAGCDRPRLTEDSATYEPVNFRSCRDTGITWLALAGVGVDKILRRAGHDDINTSLGYAKQVEDLTGRLGQPFAALPVALTGPMIGPRPRKPTGKPGENEYRRWDLNPHTR